MALTQGYQDYIQFAQTDESAQDSIADLKSKRRRNALNAAKDIASARRENLKQQGAFRHGIGAAASVIVKATPSQKDDAVLAKIIKILDCVSVVNAKIQDGKSGKSNV